MAKDKPVFECTACGARFPQWAGKCNRCGGWDTLKEAPKEDKRQRWVEEPSQVQALNEVKTDAEGDRWATGVEEFDRVLGGGFVKGSFGLLGGSPGVGKSTLILQLLNRLALQGKRVLYVSGEESPSQIKGRAMRLAIDQSRILLLVESNLQAIINNINQLQPDFVVIDSIQTLYDPELDASAGSVTQVRETAQSLLRFAKRGQASFMLIGHVTKGGDLAGPRTLEHMVDYSLMLEGDSDKPLRLLRAFKNRFGEVSEVGLFKMSAKGLCELEEASQFLAGSFAWGHPGTSFFAVGEGRRVFFLEVQVLAGDTQQSYPARTANGMEKNRLLTLLAVLEKNLRMDFSRNDVYLSLAGGMRVVEPGMDMAVMAAILSSHLLKPLPEKSLFLGEAALNGQFRSLPNLELRIREAQRAGFTMVYAPPGVKAAKGVEVVADVHRLLEVIQ